MLLQFRHPGGAPKLDDVLAAFDLRPDEVDAEYGVVATDPQAGLYVVRVAPRAGDKLRATLASRSAPAGEGLFSDPHVEPTAPAD